MEPCYGTPVTIFVFIANNEMSWTCMDTNDRFLFQAWERSGQNWCTKFDI